MKTCLVLAASIAVVASCAGNGANDGGQESPSGVSFLDPIANGQQAQPLFEVEADSPEYWRLFALDTYDGEAWTSREPNGSDTASVATPATLTPASPPGGRTLNQSFRILADLTFSHAIPLAQTPEEIAGPLGNITWNPARSEAFLDDALDSGTTYTARSKIVVPTPSELDRVEFPGPGPAIDPRWSALPDDLDPRIEEIAKQWTADFTSDYRMVLAIQERFQSLDFVYSTAVGAASDEESIVDFLTRTKTGFCQHYSGAMAVMVRTLGLPSRIGVGFRAGTRQLDGSYLVTSSDAHVWVEVFFPGYGWLQFEPEAGTDHPNAEPGNYLDPLPGQ